MLSCKLSLYVLEDWQWVNAVVEVEKQAKPRSLSSAYINHQCKATNVSKYSMNSMYVLIILFVA